MCMIDYLFKKLMIIKCGMSVNRKWQPKSWIQSDMLGIDVGLSKKGIGGGDEGKVRQVAMESVEFIKGLLYELTKGSSLDLIMVI